MYLDSFTQQELIVRLDTAEIQGVLSPENLVTFVFG